jgi:hypothetical protein
MFIIYFLNSGPQMIKQGQQVPILIGPFVSVNMICSSMKMI